MKNLLFITGLIFAYFQVNAQTNPAILSWIINTDGTTGSHYVLGNSTPIADSYLANVETVHYTNNFAFISAAGIPSYIVGPYPAGNPSSATDNEHIFKIPLNPTEETGTKSNTHGGPIGVFINGVPMYDWRDAQSYNDEGVWNRDAVPNELTGFDCSKGHPSPVREDGVIVGGKYHHHQNPSAFNLDLVELSDVCDLYISDGLYTLDASEHSPLIGYSFDGFPVYGAYGYANSDGTGGIKRMESSYQKRNITVRTHYADGTDVTDGPVVSTTYPLGNYREDYEYVAGSGDLDEYNGRLSTTAEYPGGIYAYYATVDENWNSAYPYMIGPDNYYGDVAVQNVSSVPVLATLFLPIELLSFKASPEDDHVLIEWATTTEINNDFFTLEKSNNGKNFEEIAVIRGAGNSDSVQKYDYKDKEDLNDLCYYRLKQTDYDGTSTYSRIVSVEFKNNILKPVFAFPNPATDFVAVQLYGLLKKDVEVKLFDTQGTLLATKKIIRGSTICHFDTRTLYNGEYVIQVSDGVEFNTAKVVVMK